MRNFLGTVLMILALLGLPAMAHTEFATVPALHASHVGYAGTESEIHKSFRAVLEKGDAAKPISQECLKSGTPAAKLYSAIGLYRLDVEEGKKALMSLVENQEPVPVMQGCIVSNETVGGVARDFLSGNNRGYTMASF